MAGAKEMRHPRQGSGVSMHGAAARSSLLWPVCLQGMLPFCFDSQDPRSGHHPRHVCQVGEVASLQPRVRESRWILGKGARMQGSCYRLSPLAGNVVSGRHRRLITCQAEQGGQGSFHLCSASLARRRLLSLEARAT